MLVNDRVSKWRKDHEDWKSLTAFIQMHISRRIKQKKKKNTEKDAKRNYNESDEMESPASDVDDRLQHSEGESNESVSDNDAVSRKSNDSDNDSF